MQLLTAVEKYLDNVGGFTLENEDGKVRLYAWFDDKRFTEFSNNDGYLNLIEFFKGRKITMVIKEKDMQNNEEEYFYRSSLVDTETANVVNLNSTLWGKETLQELSTVRRDSSIEFIVAIVDEVTKRFKPHSLYNTHSPMELNGYSLEEI